MTMINEGNDIAPVASQASVRKMDSEHKAALARGRSEGRIVRRYLEALAAHNVGPGRKRTIDSVELQLTATKVEIDESKDALKRLQLTQQRIDLETELADMMARVDIHDSEVSFIDVAARYAARKGISYAAFRELGVPAEVLKRAKIKRGRVQ